MRCKQLDYSIVVKIKQMSKPISTPVFQALHERIQELPENFKDFAKSECGWGDGWYAVYQQYPEMCSIEEEVMLLKIAGDLAYDLLALIGRCRRSLLEQEAKGE
jgi:hypothetical protein